jgi:ribosomal-protein-alanine N-acetyltransferase
MTVILRDFSEEDSEAIHLLLNDAEVARYLSSKIPFPDTIEDATWWVATGSKEGITKAIEFQGNFVGVVGVAPGAFEYERSAEVGYWLGKEYWGQGIAASALTQITDLVFSSTNIVRLFATVCTPNTASARVLEKCAYYRESVQKNAIYKHGELFDAYVYARVFQVRRL